MCEYTLSNLRVSLGTPRVVTEGVGHRWFPRMARTPGGRLVVTHSIVADSASLPMHGTGVHVSDDAGNSWSLNFDVTEWASIPLTGRGNGLAGPSFRTYHDPNDPPTRVRTHFAHLEDEGCRYAFEPWAVVIDGLPRPVEVRSIAGQHGQTSQAQMVLHGDAIDLGSDVLATAYLRFAGDARYSNIAIVSADGGRSWQFRSVVAGPDSVAEANEGPCEASTIRLENGDLMCVMRVGSGTGWRLCRTYSSDDGRTWSKADLLPASSVDPALCRLQNGVIALSTGRPGIDLWLSSDPRGQTWERLDIVAHHNAQFTDPGHHIVPDVSGDRAQRHAADQTTAYTALLEESPNRLLLVYDRTPFGWNPVPADSEERSRVYLLPIEIERN